MRIAMLCLDAQLRSQLSQIRKSPLSPWWLACVETMHKIPRIRNSLELLQWHIHTHIESFTLIYLIQGHNEFQIDYIFLNFQHGEFYTITSSDPNEVYSTF